MIKRFFLFALIFSFFIIFNPLFSFAQCVEGDCINGNGILKWSDGSIYAGSFRDSKFHGQGTYTWNSGSVYTGEFRDNIRTGKGTFAWANGNKYTGDFVDDKLNGNGTFTWADGSQYIGEFRDDKFNGLGTRIWLDGTKYTGYFRDDKRNGHGKEIYPNGTVYEGDFKDDKFHGKGVFLWTNGNKYIGEFIDGLASSQGTFTFYDGTVYKGSLSNIVQIAQIETDSIAQQLGFQVGDIITSYNNSKLLDAKHFDDLISKTNQDNIVNIIITRDGADKQFVLRGGKIGINVTNFFTFEKDNLQLNNNSESFSKAEIKTKEINEYDDQKKLKDLEAKITLASTSDSDKKPPEIIITEPDGNLSAVRNIQSNALRVKGIAYDQNGVETVVINGFPAILKPNGEFSLDVIISKGENEIIVLATDKNNNVARQSFKVLRRELPSATANQDTQNQPKIQSQYQPAQPTPAIQTPPQPQNNISHNLIKGNYYALIIGNNQYQFLPKLQTAVKDAKDIDFILQKEYGFKTKLLLDAKRDDIVDSLNEFRNQLKEDDNFLLYYAGHGEFDQKTGKAFWLPIDAKRDNDTKWIIVDTITTNLKRISSKHILVVADSCYSGTMTRAASVELKSPEIRNNYLNKMMDKTSRSLIASGGNEPVSDTGGNGHSIFAEVFITSLKEIKMNTFLAEELFYHYIKERVAGRSEQTPEYNVIRNSGHDGGDFVFQRIY